MKKSKKAGKKWPRKKKIALAAVSAALAATVALTGFAIALRSKEANVYEKIARPAGLSSFTEKERPLIDDADFYVSVKGSDDNDGTFDAPFRTIAKAQEAVRKGIADQGDDYKKWTVAIMAGEYNEAGITFDERDSGREDAAVTYAAYGDGEVIVNGGMTLDNESFEKVSGDAAERIDSEIIDKVKMFDLSKYGLTVEDYGKIKSVGGFTTENFYDDVAEITECEFFFNSERMVLARYPNEGSLREGKVLDIGDCYEPNPPGPKDESWNDRRNQRGGTFVMDEDTYRRVKTWETTEDVWVFGYFFWDWADMSTPIAKIDDEQKSLTTKYCSKYSFREGGTYYFYNVLEELDAPGEYYIDRVNDILYLYPPEDMENSQITISITDKSIFNITDKAQYITLDGLTIQGTRGDTVTIHGSGCTLTDCNVKNAAGIGVDVKGRNNLVQRCEISGMGKDGVVVDGGSPKGFVYGNNVIDNNSIHDYGEKQKTYISGVKINGIGNRASHNEIFNAPHEGINYKGNENIIEYNHIHDVVLQSSDAGAIYTGFSLKNYGNIVRYNCINDIGSGSFTPSAIYLDDVNSGHNVYGNIMVNIPGRAILIGGGRDNTVTDNLAVNCKGRLLYDDRAYNGYHYNGWFAMNCKAPDSRLWVLLDEAKDYNKTIGNRYEGIDRMHSDRNNDRDEGFAVNPAGSTVTGNVFISKHGDTGKAAFSARRYSDIRDNQGYTIKESAEFFKDMENGNYSFAENSKLTAENPNLKNIDLSKIGRY